MSSSSSTSASSASSSSSSSASASPAVAKQSKFFTPENLSFVKSALFQKHAKTVIMNELAVNASPSQCVDALVGVVQFFQPPPPKPISSKKLFFNKENAAKAKEQGVDINKMWAVLQEDTAKKAELETKRLKRKAEWEAYYLTRGMAVPKLYKKKKYASLAEARIVFTCEQCSQGVARKQINENWEKLSAAERKKYQKMAAAEQTDSDSDVDEDEEDEDGYSSASCMTPRGNPDSDEDDEEDEDDEPMSKKYKQASSSSSSSSSSK